MRALTYSQLRMLASLKKYGPQIIIRNHGPRTKACQFRAMWTMQKLGMIAQSPHNLHGLMLTSYDLTDLGRTKLEAAIAKGELRWYFE